MRKFLCPDYSVLIIFIVLFAVNSHNSLAQSVEDKFSEANNLMFENKFEDALNLYTELIKETTDSITLSYVYSYGGSCYENLDNDSMALDFYKQAILYKTAEYAVFNKLYSLAKNQKNIECQEFALLRKIEAFPSEKEAGMEKLGYLYASTKRYDQLLETTDLLIGINPGKYNYHYLKGFALQSKGELSGAESSYRKALELNADDYGSNVGLGLLLYNVASVAFEKEQTRYSKLKEPTWKHHMVYMEEIKRIRGIYNQAKPYLETACNTKCTNQLSAALEKIESRSKDE